MTASVPLHEVRNYRALGGPRQVFAVDFAGNLLSLAGVGLRGQDCFPAGGVIRRSFLEDGGPWREILASACPETDRH